MSTSTHTRSTASTMTGGQDKLAALHEQISDGVAALVESSPTAMLDTAAKFHSYSLGNLLLIGAQAPQATRVAGFRTWRSLGWQVGKGERGIAILAPCSYRPTAAHRAEAAPAGSEPATSGGGRRPTTAASRYGAFGWCTCSTRYPEIAVPGLSSTTSASALLIVAGARVLRKNRVGSPASSRMSRVPWNFGGGPLIVRPR